MLVHSFSIGCENWFARAALAILALGLGRDGIHLIAPKLLTAADEAPACLSGLISGVRFQKSLLFGQSGVQDPF